MVGRFAGRKSVYTFTRGGNTVPINQPVVIIVLTPITGNEPTPPSVVSGLRQMALQQFHAHTIWRGTYASAYEWAPPPTEKDLVIP